MPCPESSRAATAARDYLARGWCPIPIPLRAKRPGCNSRQLWSDLWDDPSQWASPRAAPDHSEPVKNGDDWECLRLTPDACPRYVLGNVGVNLGEPSHGLTDVDLDCPEALELAPTMLSPTLTFGRASKPRSHWLYTADGAVTEQFSDIPPEGKRNGAMLVELRGTPKSRLGLGLGGHQTVFPGSVHESGEVIAWTDDNHTPGTPPGSLAPTTAPLPIAYTALRAQVAILASAVLLQRHCPDLVAAFRAAPVAIPEGCPEAVAARIREWLRIGVPAAAPRPTLVPPDASADWFAQTRARGVRAVALACDAGITVQPEPRRGLTPCPACSVTQRGSTDKRPPVDITSDGEGWTCYHCGAKGDAVSLAARVLARTESPSPDQWGRVRATLAAAGICSPDRPWSPSVRAPEPPPPDDSDAPPEYRMPPPEYRTANGAAALRVVTDAPPRARPDNDPRPKIYITTDEHIVVSEALSAIAPDQRLYQRGGALVHVLTDQGQLAGEARPVEAPRIATIQPPRLRELMVERAHWHKRMPKGDWAPAHPPDWAISELYHRAEWPGVRMLEAIVETPVLRPDGTVLTAPGHDDRTGLLLIPSCEIHALPDPSPAAVEAARFALAEAVCDFPFSSDAHLACWVAGLLTPLARFAFTGPSPLFLVDANVRGAGKSMLADAISVILTGRVMDRSAWTEDEDEMRKFVLTIAAEGERFVLFDNIARPLGGAVLDGALTGQSAKGRRLGKNETMRGNLIATWYATGNNVQFLGDTARRCLPIRLSSPLEKPEDRKDFTHPSLLQWLSENRARLIAAALTVLNGYHAAGRPRVDMLTWGSFEGWSRAVRAPLVWAGFSDPATTREELMRYADTEGGGLAAMLIGWEEMDARFGSVGMTASEVVERLKAERYEAQEQRRDENYAGLREAITELCPARDGGLPAPRQLGYKLRHVRERVVGGRRLTSSTDRTGVARWRVERA